MIRRVVVVSGLVAMLALAGCGTKTKELAFQDTPADQLYNEALALMNAGDLRTAQVKFAEIDRLHPYTEYSRKAIMMSAFTNYERGQYQDTINDARRYLTLYPNNKDSAYAQYLIGQSYFKQIPDVTRDQSQTKRALDAMQVLVDKYPDSPYAADARTKIQATTDQLAGHEMEIGRYYLQRNDLLAAINRFKSVVQNYPRTRQAPEALFRLTEAYYASGVVPEAQTAAAVLGANFPNSQWYKDAYDLLKKGGYSPNENKSSWISRAFAGIKLL